MRFLSFILSLALLLCACSGPRIDGSSDDKLLDSIERVRTSLPETRRQPFDDSLSAISVAIEQKVDFTDVSVGTDTMRATLRRTLQGKSGEEVIAYADELRRGSRTIPAIAKNERGSSDAPRPPLVVGESVSMSGNSFGRGVSAKFGEAELRRLHSDLNGPATKAKLERYLCGHPLPPFTITLVLWYEGPYQERQVRMQMTPPLYKTDGQIETAIGYLFEQGVRALDQGPPIDYGYRKPLDGTPATPVREDQYHEPDLANCAPAAESQSLKQPTDRSHVSSTHT